MDTSNFSEAVLAGASAEYARAVDDLKREHGFDFVSIGLAAFMGAPLKWIYSAGATGERYRRIVLAPGHGIGGIVIKAGKPMMFVDIDSQIDPREYSSYPIVFAEDLHSFCALPLVKQGRVVGALLCAFRSVSNQHESVYARMAESLGGRLADLQVVSRDFLDFESMANAKRHDQQEDSFARESEVSRIISAQESERKRISRELHDGLAQELLGVMFLLNRLDAAVPQGDAKPLVARAKDALDRILDDVHNLSVELRPSALDHLGLVAALRSQAVVFERTYGAKIAFRGSLACERFDRALETQVYRICQEAVLNACKYSESDTVTVSFEDAEEWLKVSVSDRGCGFNVDAPRVKGSGCGLSGMRERANLIGAILSIESGSGGTTVTLVSPLHAPEKEAQE